MTRTRPLSAAVGMPLQIGLPIAACYFANGRVAIFKTNQLGDLVASNHHLETGGGS